MAGSGAFSVGGGMIKAIFRFAASLPLAWGATLLAWTLAPIAALPIFVTGTPPKGAYGDPREGEWLIPFWRWVTTHDAHVDQYAYGSMGRRHSYLKNYDTENPENNSGWMRYVNRVLWIWRNPAYQVKHWLGYDQRGVSITKHYDGSDTWDTGLPSKTYWTAVNNRYQRAFLWERQWYYTKHRCVEVQLGWKLYRNDPDERCMLATRVSPFRRYG